MALSPWSSRVSVCQVSLKNGWLSTKGEKCGSNQVEPPEWYFCQFVNQDRTATSRSTTQQQNPCILKQGQLKHGNMIFSDYDSCLLGCVFGGKGTIITCYKYKGGTLFCDSASNRISVIQQVSFTTETAKAAKHRFECEATSSGVSISNYSTDNRSYTYKAFTKQLQHIQKGVMHSRVGGYHHNSLAEPSWRMSSKQVLLWWFMQSWGRLMDMTTLFGPCHLIMPFICITILLPLVLVLCQWKF